MKMGVDCSDDCVDFGDGGASAAGEEESDVGKRAEGVASIGGKQGYIYIYIYIYIYRARVQAMVEASVVVLVHLALFHLTSY